jgi:hypothetical protein
MSEWDRVRLQLKRVVYGMGVFALGLFIKDFFNETLGAVVCLVGAGMIIGFMAMGQYLAWKYRKEYSQSWVYIPVDQEIEDGHIRLKGGP